jgi:hypothetical protein
VKTVVGSELSLVNGNYHEVFGPVAMEMASYGVKIRHVFGDTFLGYAFMSHNHETLPNPHP